MTQPETKEQTGDSADETQPAKRKPLGALIVLALAVVVGGWATYVWATGDGGFDFRRFAFLGEQDLEFIPVEGEAYFNGEAVFPGHIEAIPTTGIKLLRAIAEIKPDGTFEFYSDGGKGIQKGLPAGEYKLLLIVWHPSPPLTQPSPKLPAKYYEAATTPLSAKVEAGSDNRVIIREEGEIQPNLNAGRGERPDADKPDLDNREPEKPAAGKSDSNKTDQ